VVQAGRCKDLLSLCYRAVQIKELLLVPLKKQKNLLLFMPTIKLLGTLTPHMMKNDSPTTVGGIS